MTGQAMTYVHGADRMVTGARLTPSGLYVRFADEHEAVVPFEALALPERPDHVVLPDPHAIELHLADGSIEQVPWDFVRHFADPGYRARSAVAAEHDRRAFW